MTPCAGESARFTAPELPPEATYFSTNEGVVNLAWEGPDKATFELQQSPDPEFPGDDTRTRYQGTDPGSVVTGLPAGSHYFRIRSVPADAPPGEWSAPLEVRVEFIATRWVILLLISGAIVFLATLAAILRGHLRSRHEPLEP